ncbi:MAG: hypothetical protein ACI93T_003299, partial [Porticoccaceae bacterium]
MHEVVNTAAANNVAAKHRAVNYCRTMARRHSSILEKDDRIRFSGSVSFL